MPWAHFEAQSVNAHVMNVGAASAAAEGGGKVGKAEMERNVRLVVQVSGYVRFIERKEGPMRGFAESLVLVPNEEESAGGKAQKRMGWVIHSQNFRFVV